MLTKNHQYTLRLHWTGGKAPRKERYYSIDFGDKLTIEGSADKPFLGDETKLNPEEMLLGALTSCHMMSFFYVCRHQKIEIESYEDNPVGELSLNNDGSGQFDKVILNPQVTFRCPVDEPELLELHRIAGKLCFIANSLNFPVEYNPQ